MMLLLGGCEVSLGLGVEMCETPSAEVVQACTEWVACGGDITVEWCAAWYGCCGAEVPGLLRGCFLEYPDACMEGGTSCMPFAYVHGTGPQCLISGPGLEGW